jgi:hypothetical protein
MRPPYQLELWTGGNSQVLNVTMSFEAAERVRHERPDRIKTLSYSYPPLTHTAQFVSCAPS